MSKRDKYSVARAKSSDDFIRAVQHQGGVIENGGRHIKAKDPDGLGCVPIPAHGHDDLPTGTNRSIMKALLALGFFSLAGCFIIGLLSRTP